MLPVRSLISVVAPAASDPKFPKGKRVEETQADDDPGLKRVKDAVNGDWGHRGGRGRWLLGPCGATEETRRHEDRGASCH